MRTLSLFLVMLAQIGGAGVVAADAVRLQYRLQIRDQHQWRVYSKLLTVPMYNDGRRAAQATEVRLTADLLRSVLLTDDNGNHICSLETRIASAHAFIGGSMASRLNLPPMPTLLITLDEAGQLIQAQTADKKQTVSAFQNPFLGMMTFPVPDRAVDVGATWNASRQQTSRGMRDNAVKLVAFEELNGERCAKISTVFAVPAAEMIGPIVGVPRSAGGSVEIFGEGTTWFAVDRGVVVKSDGNAEFDTTLTLSGGRKQRYLTRVTTELHEQRGRAASSAQP